MRFLVGDESLPILDITGFGGLGWEEPCGSNSNCTGMNGCRRMRTSQAACGLIEEKGMDLENE